MERIAFKAGSLFREWSRGAFALVLPAALGCWPLAAFAQDAGQTPEMVIISAHPPDPVGNDAFSVMRLDGVALRAEPGLDKALEQVPGLSLFRRNTLTSANPTTQGVS